jgi:hypothetical protein
MSTQHSSFNFANIASALAVLISVSALIVSFLELSAIRTDQRTSVWPYLELSRFYGSEGFAYRLTNKGVGPAKVRTLVLTHEGETIEDLDQLILETVGPEEAFSYDLYNAFDPAGTVLSSGEMKTLFGVPWQPRTRRLSEAWFDTVDIQACYCSINDECWTVGLDDDDPEPVQACPVAG